MGELNVRTTPAGGRGTAAERPNVQRVGPAVQPIDGTTPANGAGTGQTVRRPAGAAPNAPIPQRLRCALVGERDPLAQFALICAYLRTDLVRAARAAGAAGAADDVVSDVVARAFRRLANTTPVTLASPHTYNHLRAGLLVSTRNAALNHRRSQQRSVPVEADALQTLAGEDPTPTALATVTDLVDVRALREALESLPWRDAQIARLVGVHNLTIRDVAARLGVAASTVHDSWQRIQLTLQAGVDDIVSGEVCRRAAPHLALVHAHHEAVRDDRRADQLDELVGTAEADRLVHHVYGSGGTTSGCRACRRALALQRGALQSFAPVPVMGDVLSDDGGERLRAAIARIWETTIGSIVRAAHSLAGALTGAGDPVLSGTVTPLTTTGTRLVAVVATAAIAAAGPTVLTPTAPHGTTSSHRPPVVATVTQTRALRPTPPTRTTPTHRRHSAARTPSTTTRWTPTAPSVPKHAAQRAAAEFTPGP